MREFPFTESQAFRQVWLWLLLIATTLLVTIIFAFGIQQQLILGIKWGNRPMSDTGLIIVSSLTISLLIGILILFLTARLHIRVDVSGIHYRFVPFMLKWKTLDRESIEGYSILQYDALAEHGGYGIHRSGPNKVYTVYGDYGVKIRMKNGTSVFLGTQRAEPIDQAISILLNKQK